jgi:predicted short-subunit dehydrogenase-like oxidoreductase (DUF2520 family)
MLTHRMPSAVAIVGAGRVGRALGRRLRNLGWGIGGVTTRSITTARAAVHAIGAGRPMDRLTRQVVAADVVLIATPDEAIRRVAEELAQIGGEEWRGKVVLHTSGALDSSLLEPLARAGAATGSLHPMQTFSNQNMPELAGSMFGMEGSPAALKVARKIVRQMGGVAVKLSGVNKAAYHAAGSFACAHALALVEAGTRLLMAQGFTRRQATRALLPLARQTLDNLERLGPRAAWTGPMARGDYATVERHAEALADFPREFFDAYATVSRLAAALLSDDPKAALHQLQCAVERRGCPPQREKRNGRWIDPGAKGNS